MSSLEASPVSFDCQTCGACCHGDEGWVHVGLEDDARVDSSAELQKLVVMVQLGANYFRRSLRMIRGRCEALSNTTSGVTCSVYEHRPSVCRELEAGSDGCLQARTLRGIVGNAPGG